jgi:RNase adapter protein RapZ
MMQIVLITGISGSGKSVALNVLEDAGYYCVDNLHPNLLDELVQTVASEGVCKLAVAMDARSTDSLARLPPEIRQLRSRDGHDVKALFLTASTETLVARFSETRRSHPLSHRTRNNNLTLIECIQEEREVLAAIENLGHLIDTSNLSTNQLRQWIKDFATQQAAPLTLLFESFAYKHGVPLDADFVFDVRMLPNPFYDLKLRPLTGRDAPVAAFLDAQAEAIDLSQDIHNFIAKWLPAFKNDNRSYLTVAIGCTGGQHRSVYLCERLARQFAGNEMVVLRHRELG